MLQFVFFDFILILLILFETIFIFIYIFLIKSLSFKIYFGNASDKICLQLFFFFLTKYSIILVFYTSNHTFLYKFVSLIINLESLFFFLFLERMLFRCCCWRASQTYYITESFHTDSRYVGARSSASYWLRKECTARAWIWQISFRMTIPCL